jgi:hypothetical protein
MNILEGTNYHYHKTTILKVLSHFEIGKEHSTHCFEMCASGLNGKDNRPFLTKVLRTLAHNGNIIQHKYPMNQHKWSITESGILLREQKNN